MDELINKNEMQYIRAAVQGARESKKYEKYIQGNNSCDA